MKLSVFALLLCLLGATSAFAEPLHDVLAVGNAADGTVTILDEKTTTRIGTVNVIPDTTTASKRSMRTSFTASSTIRSEKTQF